MFREQLAVLVTRFMGLAVVIYMFLFPLFYLTSVSEYVNYSKLILTILFAVLLVFLWVLRSILIGQFVISQTKFDLIMLCMALSYALSTWFSTARYVSIFGSFNFWHGTLVEIISFVAIYYAVVSNLSGKTQIMRMFWAFLLSVFIASFLGVVVYFGVVDILNLPAWMGDFWEPFKVSGFSPVGNSTSLILVLLSGLILAGFLLREVFGGLNRSRWVAYLALSVLGIAPIVVCLILWLSAYTPFRSGNLPISPQLSFASSWEIAASTIRKYPFFGAGAGNYSAAYNAYRPVELNKTDYWNLVFDQSGSDYLTVLTTLGLFGLLVSVFFVYLVVQRMRDLAHWLLDNQKVDRVQVSVTYGASIVAIVGLAMYLFTSATIVTTGIVFLALILWQLSEKGLETGAVSILSIGRSDVKPISITTGLFSGALLVVVLLVGYFTINDLQSNLAYTKSVRFVSQNVPVKDIYDLQLRAVQLNPYRDTLRLAYASTNITIAELLAQKKPEEIDDIVKQDISSLVQQSVRDVTVATETINPTSAGNWSARANLFLRLFGAYDGAGQKSIDAFNQAINLAPADVSLRVGLGRALLSIAQNVDRVTEKDFGQAVDDLNAARTTLRNNSLTQAEAVLRVATQLKDDLPSAYYALGLVYEEADQFELAEKQFRLAQGLVASDSDDYKTLQGKIDEMTTDLMPTPSVTPTVVKNQ